MKMRRVVAFGPLLLLLMGADKDCSAPSGGGGGGEKTKVVEHSWDDPGVVTWRESRFVYGTRRFYVHVRWPDGQESGRIQVNSPQYYACESDEWWPECKN